MRKFSIELPKYRLQLQLHMKLVKRRKPLLAEPLVPSRKVVNKKYRKGTLVGKVVRHVSEHKNARKVFAANLGALAIAGTLLPGSNAQTVQNSPNFAQSQEIVIQTQNTLRTEKSIQYPLESYRINQKYSYFHPGLDLGAGIGASIKPVKAGSVIEAGFSRDGYGNTVVIDHGNGLTSRYAHLSKILVKLGDSVTTENEIGKVGITGRSTGPHLHLEIRQNDYALNPTVVLSR